MSSSSKASELAALQARLAQLEQQKKLKLQQQAAANQTNNGTTNAGSNAATNPSPAPSPSPSPPSALELARAMLAAKQASKAAAAGSSSSSLSSSSTSNSVANAATANTTAGANGAPKPTPISAVAAANAIKAAAAAGLTLPSSSSLSSNAQPFVPSNPNLASSANLTSSAAPSPSSSSSASSTATSSASSSTTAASASSSASSSRPAVNLSKPMLCRSWITCTFGAKCRFRHPTVETKPFYAFGGEVLLHLNAEAILQAASANMTDSNTTPSSMPPVVLLVLTLLLQSFDATKQPSSAPSLPLMQVWSQLRTELQGCRELPSSQDELLNLLALPTTAAVVLRAAEGESVSSTEAFRNMYACVFRVTRKDGAFHLSFEWDAEKRAQLEANWKALQAWQQSKKKKPHHATASANGAISSSSSFPASNGSHAAAFDGGEDPDVTRKRKRVPDSAIAALNNGESHQKLHRGEAYPEEEAAAATPPVAAVPRAPAAPASRLYSMNAGTNGGSTTFVRGGIVTELSLLAPVQALRQEAVKKAQQEAAAAAGDAFDDPFTRAIRRQREVSTHATYTIKTNQIRSGKGYEMLQRMNWSQGQGLGKNRQGIVEPLEVKFRADRTGL